MTKSMVAATTLAALLAVSAPGFGAPQRSYVGSLACKDCHAEQYDNYKAYSKKAKSSHSIKIMLRKLTPEEVKECYACHTTGYGKPGGFVSFEATPDMADAGCEVCHGPGSEHVAAQTPGSIRRKASMEECKTCHNEARVKSFGFKPVTHSGAH